MNNYYLIAAILTLLMAITHSLMGEKYFLVQLFQRDYPPELMGAKFVNRTIRIAWHLTSISWAAAGIILIVLALNPVMPMGGIFARIIAVCFLLSALLSAIGSHGRHLSWIIFVLIAVLAWLG